MPVEASTEASEVSPGGERSGRTKKSNRNGCAARLWKQFSKQETPGHRTIFSLRFAIIIFACMCVAFLVGGAVLLTVSLRQVQIRVTYSDVDELAMYSNANRSLLIQGIDPETRLPRAQPLTSTLELTVEEDMDSTIYVYYVLSDFYQNHKRYVRSVDYNQLHGEEVAASTLDACVPQKFVGGDRNNSLPGGGLVNPCGLTAWSLFNDSFTGFAVLRTDASTVQLAIDQSDLVWDSDRDTFFGNYTPQNHNPASLPQYRGGRGLEMPINSDELFMGWMRPAAHPTVRKYYGKINEDLKKGDKLRFEVTHQYNTYDFGGEKSLLFTTQSAFGNRNLTFGLVWLVMGVLCGIITVTYIILGREQLMDPSMRQKNLERWWNMSDGQRS